MANSCTLFHSRHFDFYFIRIRQFVCPKKWRNSSFCGLPKGKPRVGGHHKWPHRLIMHFYYKDLLLHRVQRHGVQSAQSPANRVQRRGVRSLLRHMFLSFDRSVYKEEHSLNFVIATRSPQATVKHLARMQLTLQNFIVETRKWKQNEIWNTAMSQRVHLSFKLHS
jgi:hypothetical protein